MLQAFDIIGSDHDCVIRVPIQLVLCVLVSMHGPILGATPVKAHIRFSGSFAKTYKGHGTDKAVIAGILGMDTDEWHAFGVSMDVAKEEGLAFEFEEADIDGAHPNTAEITLEDAEGRTAQVQGASVGGGNIVINKINGTAVSINGKSDTLVIPHQDIPGMIAVVTKILAEKGVNVHGFSLCRDHKGGTAVMTIEIDGDINESVQDAILENPHIFSCTILKAI